MWSQSQNLLINNHTIEYTKHLDTAPIKQPHKCILVIFLTEIHANTHYPDVPSHILDLLPTNIYFLSHTYSVDSLLPIYSENCTYPSQIYPHYHMPQTQIYTHSFFFSHTPLRYTHCHTYMQHQYTHTFIHIPFTYIHAHI